MLQRINGIVLVMWLLVGCGAAPVKPQPGVTFTGPLELIHCRRWNWYYFCELYSVEHELL
jgi:hypothetical protein